MLEKLLAKIPFKKTIIAAGLILSLASCSGSIQGEEGGSCYPNGTCNTGLSCYSNICVSVPSEDGGNSVNDGGVFNNDGGSCSPKYPCNDGGLVADAGITLDGGIMQDGGTTECGECRPASYDIEICGPNHRGIRYRECNDQCAWGAWSNCIPDEECVDGTIEEKCCGFNGAGTKQRNCIVGQGRWSEFSDCTIENFINVSNSSARDYKPSMDGDTITFTSLRVIAGVAGGSDSKIMFVNTLNLNNVEPECISCNLRNIIDADFFSSSDWSYWCDNSSISGKKVAFDCEWMDEDLFFHDFYHDFLYVLNLETNPPYVLDMCSERNERGRTPSIYGDKFVAKSYSAGEIKVFNSTSGALISNFGQGEAYPDISSDHIAFASNRSGSGLKAYIGDLATGNINRISGSGINADGYASSIDGTDAVFVSERDGNKQLYYYNLESEAIQRLTNCNNNYEPSVSNGKVSFTSERDGNKQIYVCDLRQTGDCCSNAINISNSLSTDNSSSASRCKVAFVTDRTGNQEIFVYDLCEGGCRE